MDTNQAAFHDFKCRRINLFLLAFFTICGCSLGVYTSHVSDINSFHLMRMAVTCPVSIVGLTFVMLLPFLITAFAIWISKPYFILPVSFFKSFSFTLVLCYTIAVFDAAGWLMCLMLLFSNISVQFSLNWLWIRLFSGTSRSLAKDLLLCVFCSLAIIVVDYFFVAPYLVQLTNI